MSTLNNPTKITKYERTKIIGQRALQIANGAIPLVDFDLDMRPERIAEKEFDAEKTPLVLQRTMPDGKIVEIDLTTRTIIKANK